MSILSVDEVQIVSYVLNVRIFLKFSSLLTSKSYFCVDEDSGAVKWNDCIAGRTAK